MPGTRNLAAVQHHQGLSVGNSQRNLSKKSIDMEPVDKIQYNSFDRRQKSGVPVCQKSSVTWSDSASSSRPCVPSRKRGRPCKRSRAITVWPRMPKTASDPDRTEQVDHRSSASVQAGWRSRCSSGMRRAIRFGGFFLRRSRDMQPGNRKFTILRCS